MAGWFPWIAAESVVIGAALLALGFLVADATVGGRGLDAVTRWALAFPGVVAYSLLLMLAHIASRGHVFSSPWVVRGVTLATGALLAGLKIARRPPRTRSSSAAILGAAAMVALGLLVWATPVARVAPLEIPGSDTGWHMGWTGQLLNGEATPSSIITGGVPNYYPWMFHALAALVANLTPGGRAFHALGPLQVLQVAGALLALFALGSFLGRSWQSGAATALFGGIAAGLAFAVIRSIDQVIETPRSGGPRGTYNVVFNNLAPPLPRDLGYALFAAFLVLVVVGTARRDMILLVAAGATLGLIGLTAAEFFFVGLAVGALVVPFMKGGRSRWLLAASVVLPALGIYTLWLIPLLASYRHLGGFVNTTAVRAITLSPTAILMSWGLSTPFAVIGAVRWIPRIRRDQAARVALGLLLLSGGLLAAAAASQPLLGEGFLILGRASRYWPLLHLAVAVYAGLGAGALLLHLGKNHRTGAAAAAISIVLVAVLLPWDVSWDYPGRRVSSEVLANAVLGRESNLLTAVARPGRGRCVVATPSLQFTTFAYTGYRMVALEGSPTHRGNFARIRWRDIYHRIPSDEERLGDLGRLTDGSLSRGSFRAIVAKYGVNLLVIPRSRMLSPAYDDYPDLGPASSRYAVLLVSPCPR